MLNGADDVSIKNFGSDGHAAAAQREPPRLSTWRCFALRRSKRIKMIKNGPAESERVIGFAKLVGQLEAVIHESGNPEGFDAVTWISRWLNDPVPALGGARPFDLMDTMEGQALVSTTLAQLQSGAYA